jgi:delta 1-pyrroline-5-carboxylate dehydrogenase
MSAPAAIERATDAHNTLGWLQRAAADQPRILADCARAADLSWLAGDVAKRAAELRAIADDLDAAASAMRPNLREVA